MQPGQVAVVALDGQPVGLLRDRLEGILEQPGVRVVVLVGGSDSQPGRGDDCAWLERYVLPTIFCFEDTLSEQALAAAVACDIRVCGAAASIRYSPRALPASATRRLILLLGRAGVRLGARERGWTARQALRAGLVSALAPAGQARTEAERIASIIASRGPIATRLAKEAIWRGLEMPLAQGLRFETDLTLLLQTTKDRAEGVAAFLEKRQPQFTGE